MLTRCLIALLFIAQNASALVPQRRLRSGIFSAKDLIGYNTSHPRAISPNIELSAGDQYGHAISIYGDIALISATGKDVSDSSGAVIDGGMVFQFYQQNGAWKQQNAVLTSGVLSDAFGESLAICEGLAVIGAWKDSSFGTFSGKAYLFTLVRKGGTAQFIETQVLTMDNPSAGDFFGFSVAVVPQFDTYMTGAAIIGAFGHNRDDAVVDSGAVLVFAHISDSWIQVAMLQASDGASFDSFGWSISAHDNVIAVGAPEAGSNSDQGGAAYLYVFQSEVIRNQRQRKLQGGGGGGGGQDQRDRDQQQNPDQQREQQRQQEQQMQTGNFLVWNYMELMKFTSTSGGSANGMFGVDVAVRNESGALTVAVGACLDNAKGYHAGAVYVYSRLRNGDIMKKFVYGDNKNQNQNQNQQQKDQQKNQQQQQQQGQKRVRRSLSMSPLPEFEMEPPSSSSLSLSLSRRTQGEGPDAQQQQQHDQQQQQNPDQQQRDQQQNLEQQQRDQQQQQQNPDQQQQQGQQGRWEIIVSTDFIQDRLGRCWIKEAALVGSADLMRFGRSLALSGGALLVGADMSGLSAGRAFVFTRQQSSRAISSSNIISGPLRNSTWVKVANLHNSHGSTGDFFGASCDIDGKSAIVGAYMNSASDKLKSSSRSGDSDEQFPGAAYAFMSDEKDWITNSAGSAVPLYMSSTFMATLALTLALLVVVVAGMLVFRGLFQQKDRGYLHTNTMDSSSITARSDSAIDVSSRSSDPLQPSLGGSSGLHLSSFRKKRNKVASMSNPLGGGGGGGTGVLPHVGIGGSATDPYHSPNLLEEHGMGLSSSSTPSRSALMPPGSSTYSTPHTDYYATLGDPSSASHLTRGNLPHGVSSRPGASTSTNPSFNSDGRRRSTLTKKATGTMEMAPPSDF